MIGQKPKLSKYEVQVGQNIAIIAISLLKDFSSFTLPYLPINKRMPKYNLIPKVTSYIASYTLIVHLMMGNLSFEYNLM